MILALSLLPATFAAAPQDVMAFPSGLHVLLFEDHRFPVVHATLAVGAGNADSPHERADLAHVVEHLLFRTDVGGGRFEDRLATLGCAQNGSTAMEMTELHGSCPAEAGEGLIDSLLGVMDGQLAGISDQDAALEARIVLHEYAWREDTLLPVYDDTLVSVYGGGHPYGGGVLPGEDAAPVSVAAARAFAAEQLAPGNVVLVVVGDADKATVLRALARHPALIRADLDASDQVVFPAEAVRFLGFDAPMAWFPDAKDPSRPLGFSSSRTPTLHRQEPPQWPSSPERTVEAPVLDPMTVVAWSLPGVTAGNYFQLELVGKAAGGEISGILPDRFSSGCFVDRGREASTLMCTVAYEDADDRGLAERRVSRAFQRPWTWRQENRVERGLATGTFAQRIERDDGGVATATSAAEHFLLTDLAIYFSEKNGRQGAFIPSDYLAVRDRYLRSSRAAILRVEPGGAVPDLADGGISLSTSRGGVTAAGAPIAGPLSNAILGRTELTLENGFHVVLVPVDGSFGTLRLLFAHPAGYSPELAYLVDEHLRPPAKFHGRPVEFRRIYPRGEAAWYGGAGYTMPPRLYEDAEETLFIMRSAYDGAVPHGIPHVYVEQRLRELARSWRTPQYWLEQQFVDALAGAGRTFGSSSAEVKEAGALSDAAIATYLQTKFAPGNATLTLVGPYDPKRLGDAITARFAPWSGGAAAPLPPRSVTPPNRPPPGTTVLEPLRPRSEVDVELACGLDFAGLDPAQTLAVQQVLSGVLTVAARESVRDRSGAAYVVDGFVSDEPSFGGPTAHLRATVSVDDVAATRALLVDALDPARLTPDVLAAARHRVFSSARVSADSLVSTSNWTEYFVGHQLPLAAADGYADVLTSVDATALRAVLAPCHGHELYAVIGDPAAVGPVLDAAGVAWQTAAWREALEARLDELPSTIAADERSWQSRHRATW